MDIENMENGSPKKELAKAKNGREYFEMLNGTPYTVQNEWANRVKIDIRPGLLAKVIAAGVAVEKGKAVFLSYKENNLLSR